MHQPSFNSIQRQQTPALDYKLGPPNPDSHSFMRIRIRLSMSVIRTTVTFYRSGKPDALETLSKSCDCRESSSLGLGNHCSESSKWVKLEKAMSLFLLAFGYFWCIEIDQRRHDMTNTSRLKKEPFFPQPLGLLRKPDHILQNSHFHFYVSLFFM